MKPIRWHDDKNKFSIDHLWALMEIGIMPDTDYMRVPRCDGCKHWGENEGGEGLGNGRCGYADYHPDKFRAEMYDAVLTAADFGCVQWEAK